MACCRTDLAGTPGRGGRPCCLEQPLGESRVSCPTLPAAPGCSAGLWWGAVDAGMVRGCSSEVCTAAACCALCRAPASQERGPCAGGKPCSRESIVRSALEGARIGAFCCTGGGMYVALACASPIVPAQHAERASQPGLAGQQPPSCASLAGQLPAALISAQHAGLARGSATRLPGLTGVG